MCSTHTWEKMIRAEIFIWNIIFSHDFLLHRHSLTQSIFSTTACYILMQRNWREQTWVLFLIFVCCHVCKQLAPPHSHVCRSLQVSHSEMCEAAIWLLSRFFPDDCLVEANGQLGLPAGAGFLRRLHSEWRLQAPFICTTKVVRLILGTTFTRCSFWYVT